MRKTLLSGFLGVSLWVSFTTSAIVAADPPLGRWGIMIDQNFSPYPVWNYYPGRMTLWDLEAGDIIAEATIGRDPHFAVSSNGSLIGVVSQFPKEAGGPPIENHLQVYRTTGLKLVSDGRLPFSNRYLGSQWNCAGDHIAFADQNRLVIVQRWTPGGPDYNLLQWTALDWRALGAEEAGVYPVSGRWKDCVGIITAPLPILTTSGWPLMDIYVHWEEEVVTFDFRTGQIESRFRVDGAVQEQALPCGATLQSRSKRILVSDRAKLWVYSLPGMGNSGRIAKLNLPERRLDRKSGQEIMLTRPIARAVSEDARSIFVADLAGDSSNIAIGPNRIRVFDTETLAERSGIDVKTEFSVLDTSWDGKRLYAVGPKVIQVFDASSLRLVNTFEHRCKGTFGSFAAVPGLFQDEKKKSLGAGGL